MKLLKQDLLTVVQRANGERTTELCRQILERNVSAEFIVLIQEKPFIRAVKKSFEIGFLRESKYLLVVDSDTLLFDDAISYMLYMAKKQMNEKVFRIDYMGLDKFRGKEPVGAHLYNNRYSEAFLKYLGDTEYCNFLRPEYENVKAFSIKNNLDYSIYPPQIVGKHDYYQYYGDIYHKYITRGKRCIGDANFDEISKRIDDKRTEYKEDYDYVFALEGMKAVNGGNPISDDIINEYGISEKESIPQRDYFLIIKELNKHKIELGYEKNEQRVRDGGK